MDACECVLAGSVLLVDHKQAVGCSLQSAVVKEIEKIGIVSFTEE